MDDDSDIYFSCTFNYATSAKKNLILLGKKLNGSMIKACGNCWKLPFKITSIESQIANLLDNSFSIHQRGN